MTHILRRLILAFALMAGLAPAFAQAPPPVPALPDTERRTSYTISASTCACAVNFALYGDSTDYGNWLEVWINGVLIPSSNYTITSPTGPLSSIPRPITDAVLTFSTAQTGTVQIVGARRPRRVSQFSENRGVAARDLNQAITDIVAQNRETWDKINDVTGRAVLAPPGETLAVLAAAANRKNLGACFDNSGNLTSCASVPTSTLAAGSGIALTGIGPTTITNNIQATSPLAITGTNPLVISCSSCNTAVTPTVPSVTIESQGGGCLVSDNTAALNAAVASVAGGVRVLFPNNCTYNFTQANAINFSKTVYLEGAGINATYLQFNPTSGGTFLKWSNGVNVMFGGGARNLSLYTTDTTYFKVGISWFDVSGFYLNDVSCNGSIGWTDAGHNSICIYSHGRDTSVIRNIVANANQPIRIGMNPHSYQSADVYHFSDLYLLSDLSNLNGNPVIFVDPGVIFTDTTFDGMQSWNGGGDGFQYVDNAAVNFVSSIASGGTGYTAGQVLTVSGGTCSTAIQIQVLSVTGGIIQAASIANPGVCTVTPSNPVAVTTGTATFNLTLVAGYRLKFANVRTEQGYSTGSSTFDIRPKSQLQGFTAENILFDPGRCGALFNNTIYAMFTHSTFGAGGGCNLAVDFQSANGNDNLIYVGNWAQIGASQNVTGLSNPYSIVGSSNSSTTVPSTAFYSSVATSGLVVKYPVYTVATLPTCGSGGKGTVVSVSDATSPAYNGSLTGGGAVAIPVFCNGSAWTAH